jgi:hypothetical protein
MIFTFALQSRRTGLVVYNVEALVCTKRITGLYIQYVYSVEALGSICKILNYRTPGVQCKITGFCVYTMENRWTPCTI